MSPNEEKLDPRVKRTRQMILQAFSELVEEKGFQGLNVQDITEKAGINRATFYAHFPDKYALLDHAIQQEFREEIDRRMLNACQFSQDNLRILIMAVCEFVEKTHRHCPKTEPQFQSLVEAQVRGQINGLIDHWLENMEPNNAIRDRAAIAASWAIYGLASEWSRSKRMPPLEQFTDEVFPLVAANLGLVGCAI